MNHGLVCGCFASLVLMSLKSIICLFYVPAPLPHMHMKIISILALHVVSLHTPREIEFLMNCRRTTTLPLQNSLNHLQLQPLCTQEGQFAELGKVEIWIRVELCTSYDSHYPMVMNCVACSFTLQISKLLALYLYSLGNVVQYPSDTVPQPERLTPIGQYFSRHRALAILCTWKKQRRCGGYVVRPSDCPTALRWNFRCSTALQS
jgi:hypothetical protein